MADIRDVARHAGVSISTVSNVINGTQPVSEELTARVKRAIDLLQYEVNPIGRSLKSRRTMSIAMIVHSLTHVFFPQITKGIQDMVQPRGYALTLCDTNGDIDREHRYVRSLAGSWVDGIVIDSVAHADDRDYLEYLSRLGGKRKRIPVVSLERRLGDGKISCVTVDNVHGGRLATSHLIEKECRRIAHIGGPLFSDVVQGRLKGYKETLREAGLEFRTELVMSGDFTPLSGYHVMKRLLVAGVDIDGVFAANDAMAVGALKAIEEHGLRVPEDIRLVGFDNVFVSSLVQPSITTINVPRYRMGTEAAKLLLRAAEDPTSDPSAVELPINLLVRESTDLRGVGNWDLYGW